MLPVEEPPSRALQIVETVQTILTGIALAFVFRAFFVEAFIIPTGSMAQSLLGAHATRTCPNCGWEFDFLPLGESYCPNCHLRRPLAQSVATKGGDRLLVHKWPYAIGSLFEPRRWDVIVFRNPSDPSENYIKRLVGLPGETVEIVDGDVFINGHVARKTPAAQGALWFVVFDQNHYPRGQAGSTELPRWVADPPVPETWSGWSGLETRTIHYRGLDELERSIRFAVGHDPEYGQDVYAYNRGPTRPDAPYVGDVRIVAELTVHAGDGACRWELTRDELRFVAEARPDGRVSLAMGRRGSANALTKVAQAQLPPRRYGRPYVLEFGHLDYRVYLEVDGREVLSTTDAEYGPDLAALRTIARARPVELRIDAFGLDLELRGLRVDRDVYYTHRDRFTRRAYPGHPFALKPDECFVLGDNSPDSRDSREWDEVGPHLPPDYRVGTVRVDQIVGPAAFVYLPGLLPIDSKALLGLPDLGRVRFVR